MMSVSAADRPVVIAPSMEQAFILTDALGLKRSTIVTTGRGSRGLPNGLYPLPDDVHYAPGWENGPAATKVLSQLRRVYAKRLYLERPA